MSSSPFASGTFCYKSQTDGILRNIDGVAISLPATSRIIVYSIISPANWSTVNFPGGSATSAGSGPISFPRGVACARGVIPGVFDEAGGEATWYGEIVDF